VFFSPFAGNGGSHSQQRREGKKKAGQFRPFPGIVSGGAFTHAPLASVASGGDAPPLFRGADGLPCNFWSFRGSFCKF